MIREHEVPVGQDFCKHCGARRPGPESTCIVRDGVAAEQPCPEPARRVPACDDADAIQRRIAELRKEQEAGWNAESAT